MLPIAAHTVSHLGSQMHAATL